MKFEFEGHVYSIPTSLSQILVKEWVEFHNQFGKEIEAEVNRIDELPDNELKDLEVAAHRLTVACKSVSFFSGIPMDRVVHININQLLNLYESSLKQLLEHQEEIELQTEYQWHNELWYLEQPELTHKSEMSFNEFLTAKQIVKELHELGKGNWESLPYLCAIFLRKKDEHFSEELIDGERLILMHDLPMDIALSVAFFLLSSIKIYQNNLASLVPDQVQE